MSPHRNRHPSGTPTGGQFATTTRSEAPVALNPGPGSYSRSGDQPHTTTWQWPTRVHRFDALTAYDDDAGTYTIGDDLHLTGGSSRWMDHAREPLAGLHRAGLTGPATVFVNPIHTECWNVDATTGAGTRWSFDIDHPDDRLIITVRLPGGSERTVVFEGGTVNQPVLDDTVERAVREAAFAAQWRHAVTEQHGGRSTMHGRAFVPHRHLADPRALTLVLTPPGPAEHEVVVRDGVVVEHVVRHPTKGTQRHTGAEGLPGLATQLGIHGGQRAGAPELVHRILLSAADVDDHPDLVWLREYRSSRPAH